MGEHERIGPIVSLNVYDLCRAETDARYTIPGYLRVRLVEGRAHPLSLLFS